MSETAQLLEMRNVSSRGMFAVADIHAPRPNCRYFSWAVIGRYCSNPLAQAPGGHEPLLADLTGCFV